MRRKGILWMLSILVCFMAGCLDGTHVDLPVVNPDGTIATPTPVQTQILTAAPTEQAQMPDSEPTSGQVGVTSKPATPTPTPVILPSEQVLFDQQGYFYNETTSLTLTLDSVQKGQIYYTLDGTDPDETSMKYAGPIELAAVDGTISVYHVRAMAVREDGTTTNTVVHTFFVGEKVTERFSTLIFVINGDKTQLTEGSDGILFGENVLLKGREHEVLVSVEAIQPDGTEVFTQYAGVRVAGGKSRQYAIPSLKLYARKEYSPERGTFPFSLFETPREDKPDKVVKKYDKLILDNGGDDFQSAMIRDELAHMLSRSAGFTDYESVLPTVVYLNGEYYGLMWLHEAYCDEYFQQKYGSADGEFVVLEGSEKTKNLAKANDELEKAAVREFNAFYNKYATLDLTVEANYQEICKRIDVENYLRFYAYVLYGGIYDWPNRNYACYRYYPTQDGAYGEGVYDGRWRFLIHDLDSMLGMHTKEGNIRYAYNDWADVMDSSKARYSPLFASLMKRKDCRKYFVDYTYEIMNTAFSYENVEAQLNQMNEQRKGEIPYYYEHLRKLKANGNTSIWTNATFFDFYMDQIMTYVKERPEYAKKYIKQLFQ